METKVSPLFFRNPLCHAVLVTSYNRLAAIRKAELRMLPDTDESGGKSAAHPESYANRLSSRDLSGVHACIVLPDLERHFVPNVAEERPTKEKGFFNMCAAIWGMSRSAQRAIIYIHQTIPGTEKLKYDTKLNDKTVHFININ